MSIPLPRRGLAPLALAALLPAAAARAAPPAPLRFRIIREGSAIGTHRVSFAERGGGEIAALTEVDIAVKLAGFTVFRFTHRFEEIWAGPRLQRVASRLDRNGTVTEMQARAEGEALLVRGPEGPARLPAQAAPLSWWDVARIEAERPLFDNSSGKPLRLTWTRTPLPQGGRRWRCTGDRESEGVWGADGTWMGWTTKGDDGSVVVYERA